MTRYKGTVCVTYTQVIEVEADSKAEAEATMIDWFDASRCVNTAEAWVYDLEEVQPEGASK
jgi:hypothetical protein